MIEQAQAGQTDRDFIPFHQAGENATGAFRCADCGYGVAITIALPICPMCGSTVWEKAAWNPFSDTRLP